jgi:5-methylcytosine-specific restriction enzyme subunit McrC
LLLSFPELADISVQQETFEKLVFDRKTTRYKEAIEIAAMLLLNYRPDISTGQNHILAILFDMNDLWEEFIYRQIYKSKPRDWTVGVQNSKAFWKLTSSNSYKTVRPDIVIENQINGVKIIVDTKWKIPDKNIPADTDLKQMFVYNEYWTGQNAILLYPNAIYTDKPVYHEGAFAKKEKAANTHGCGVMKMAVLDKNNMNLDNTIGKRINDFLKAEILK